MGDKHLQADEDGAEGKVRRDDTERTRRAELLDAREYDTLSCQDHEAERERHPDGNPGRHNAEGARQQRAKRRHGRLDDRGLAAGDAAHLRQGKMLVPDDAVGECMRVDVREPEDRGRDEDHDGDAGRVARERLRASHENREDDDRPVDEARQPLTERRTAEAAGPVRLRFGSCARAAT